MRKGVAVGYVIALILGIVVIALIGVLLAVTGGKFSGQSAATQCNTDKIQWCLNWGANNYVVASKPSTPSSCSTAAIPMPVDGPACKLLLGLT